ncbi:helix-turn-helix domain-containing protein [Chromobacterium haemolyticum]|uniref:helix-turn-helix domain-containing protein n=1 Tax=Chromobacterium haemolyticum TaxID=394935 RepID=UPI0009DB287F|nr:helix-turn-helix domain-containing protein [Chromobacterium haemolyticum]OQS28261.1 transcriptional regulator [Chromobacterium haemolyticum]PTU69379.1 helix-turn-helix domain-containing protein [Chromobacterium haemolyticum]
MPTDKELAARDAQRDLGAELLESVRQMKAGQAARCTQITPTLAAQARSQMGMSQTEFAALLDVSKRTLQEWEQGRRMPTGAAQTLLRVAVQHPEALRELK